MIKIMQQLYDISEELKQVLNNIERSNRDDMLPKINELINQRETYIKKIEAPFTEEELEFGKKIIRINKEIQMLMNSMFTEVKADIVKLKQNKSSNMSYINPYSNTEMTDGIYLDSKK